MQAAKAILNFFFFFMWVVIKPFGLTMGLKLLLTILLNWGLGDKIMLHALERLAWVKSAI